MNGFAGLLKARTFILVHGLAIKSVNVSTLLHHISRPNYSPKLQPINEPCINKMTHNYWIKNAELPSENYTTLTSAVAEEVESLVH